MRHSTPLPPDTTEFYYPDTTELDYPDTTRYGYATNYKLGRGSYSHVWRAVFRKEQRVAHQKCFGNVLLHGCLWQRACKLWWLRELNTRLITTRFGFPRPKSSVVQISIQRLHSRITAQGFVEASVASKGTDFWFPWAYVRK